MAEEDQDEGFGMEVGKARGSAVEALELAIGDCLAVSQHSKLSATEDYSRNCSASALRSGAPSVADSGSLSIIQSLVEEASILAVGERTEVDDSTMRRSRRLRIGLAASK
jgi:hypothetical protein